MDSVRRARLLVAVCGAAVVLGPLYVALFWILGLPVVAWTCLITTACLLGVPFVLRWTGQIVLAGNLFAAVLFLAVAIYSVQVGGLRAPGALWFCAFPAVALTFAGARSGLFWAVAAVVQIVGLTVADRRGLLAPPELSEAVLLAIGAASDIGLTLAVLSFAYLFEVEKNGAVRRLSEVNRELEVASRAAQAADRAKSEFLAHMSHEIRTPMNGVLGMSDLLSRRATDAEDRRMSQTIRDSAEALLAILDGLLDLAKIEAHGIEVLRQPSSPRQIVDDVTALFRESAALQGIELRVEVEEDVPESLVVDPTRIRQVLVNLIGNAVKFTEEGSVDVRLGYEVDAERASIEVHDTGVGVSAEQMERIFEPFAQALQSSGQRGTGLGLAITRRLVEAMGGEIGVESRRGRGSTFRVLLPAPPGRVAIGDDGSASAQAFAPPSGAVLIADDNPVNLEVLVGMMRRLGFDCDTAADGREALETFRPERHRLLLLDCRMPRLDGYEVAARLREEERRAGRSHRLRIVAVTASALPEDRQRALDAGMDGHLAKPFSLDALERKLVEWGDLEPAAAEPSGGAHMEDDAPLGEVPATASDAVADAVDDQGRSLGRR